MFYRAALALGLLLLGAYLGRELSRTRTAVAATPRNTQRLPKNLLTAPMDNVSVH